VKYLGKRWSVGGTRIGNGSKQIGLVFWWHAHRVALQVDALFWEVQIMKERK
jgi:hypothetical protein